MNAIRIFRTSSIPLPICIAITLIFSALQASAQTYTGYTLYSQQGTTKAYLTDMAGAVYHTWTFASNKPTGYSTYMLAGGTLLRTVSYTGNSFSGGGMTGEVQKVDYNGTVLWDYIYSTTTYCAHHDICAMPNGNVLIIAYESKTAAEVTAAGCSQSIIMWPEKIVEVQPSGASGGTIVWEWHVWDHLCQNYNAAKSNYVTSIVQHPELININYLTSKDWMHANGIDYNAALDQITFSSHMLNEVYVIDHSTTTAQAATHTGGNSGKGGDILYRWGNPAAYQATGTTIFNVVHDAHWVPADCPSYANSLCGFNNRGGTGSKNCVDIFTPPINGYNYTITLGSAYTPATYNWRHTYTGTAAQDMGNSQQLPNGNTLICIPSGYIYEINPSQTTVWSKTVASTVAQAFRYPPCFLTGTYSANATATPSSMCGAGSSVQLNVTATGDDAYSYAWSSTPTGFTSTLQNPVVSPTVTTVYAVTIKNGPCSATGNVTVTVNPLPAAAAGSNRSVCAGQGTQLGATAVAGSTYSWSSSPSGFTSTLANPTVSPTVTTVYTLTETVTATGCTKSNTVTVTVNALPAATAGSNRSVCAGTATQLGATAVAGSTYSWVSSPAGFVSTLANPTVTPAATTTYTVTETVTATGCSKSNSVTVTVNPLPAANAGTSQAICPGWSVQIGAAAVSGSTYSWSSSPAGYSSMLANPTVSPVSTTVYTLVETVTATGCSATGTVTVTVNPVPNAYTGGDRTVCSGYYTQLGAAAVEGNVYSWTSVPAGFSSTLANPYVSPVVPTTYTLTETNLATGCYNVNSAAVGINPIPAAIAGTNATVNPGGSVQLGSPAVAGNTYSWSSDPPGFTSTLANPVVYPAETTLYMLTESITATGCSHSNSVEITVSALPVQLALPSTSVAAGQSVCFNATETITAGGEGTPFAVASGGSAILIAGETVRFVPECTVAPGGSLLAYITQTGTYCGGASDSPVAQVVKAGLKTGPGVLVLFPNPTSGTVQILLPDNISFGKARTEIISMNGNTVLNDGSDGTKTGKLNLSGLAPGLYLVRVTDGTRTLSGRLIKE